MLPFVCRVHCSKMFHLLMENNWFENLNFVKDFLALGSVLDDFEYGTTDSITLQVLFILKYFVFEDCSIIIQKSRKRLNRTFFFFICRTHRFKDNFKINIKQPIWRDSTWTLRIELFQVYSVRFTVIIFAELCRSLPSTCITIWNVWYLNFLKYFNASCKSLLITK